MHGVPISCIHEYQKFPLLNDIKILTQLVRIGSIMHDKWLHAELPSKYYMILDTLGSLTIKYECPIVKAFFVTRGILQFRWAIRSYLMFRLAYVPAAFVIR